MTDSDVKDMCGKLKKAFGRRLPDAKLDDMVDRFLSWKLPKDFYPDCGIEFTPPENGEPEHFWPSGTNLFNAEQAKEMLEYAIFGEENKDR